VTGSHRFPSLGIGVAVVEEARILLTRRRDFPVWCIPGGHLSPGESLLDTAVREAKEETGLDVELTGLVGIYSMPYKWEDGSCEIILRGRRSGGNLTKSTDETVDAGYFSLEELPSDLIGWQYHQAVDALCGKSGVLAVLDVRLSLAQFREAAARANEGNDASKDEWLSRVCARPSRIELDNAEHP
jgi:ADP-ribose pyrophosphatase YjhB (NUDIX family)